MTAGRFKAWAVAPAQGIPGTGPCCRGRDDFVQIAPPGGERSTPTEGGPDEITTPARTVADCFRYRNKVGIDVAMEALRDAVRMTWSGQEPEGRRRPRL